MLDGSKYILFTIDLEEFDLPLEYGISLPSGRMMSVTNKGLSRIYDLLEKHNIRATFFITSGYAEANAGMVRKIAEKHEISSHSHSHTLFHPGDPGKSKNILEEISRQKINGFRMPRMAKTDLNELKQYGYSYDASVNPTLVPFRYNMLSSPRTLFRDKATGLPVVPVSVSPVIRFPLFWLSFKNLPFGIFAFLCKRTLDKDKYLHLYFHSWEFADIRHFRIPFYIRRKDGDQLTNLMERLLLSLKRQGEFIGITEFLQIRKMI